MRQVKELLPNDVTIQRRKRISLAIEAAIKEDPSSVSELIQAINKAYKKGTITRYWDLVAALAGCDRGYGNDWFYSAVELLERSQK